MPDPGLSSLRSRIPLRFIQATLATLAVQTFGATAPAFHLAGFKHGGQAGWQFMQSHDISPTVQRVAAAAWIDNKDVFQMAANRVGRSTFGIVCKLSD